MMDQLNNKITIITGGASGIGRALAEEMGRRGAVIVVADIDKKMAMEVAATINSKGGQAKSVHLDVSKGEDVGKLIDETVEEYGRIDYMVNNAGIATLGEVRYMTPEQWRRIIDINLLGVIYGTIAAYSVMVKQGSGHIVNTASQAGLYSIPGTTSYALTKHGVVGLSTSLRAEGADLGVKVSVICPGPVQTNIYESATVTKGNIDFITDHLPQSMIVSADKAALIILQGIERNHSIIVFPFSARILWWFHRLYPPLVDFISRMGMIGFRRFQDL